MNYSYSDINGDRIRKLHDRTTQMIKPGIFTKHTEYNKKSNSYSNQNSTFSNCVLSDSDIYQHYGFASAPLSGSKNISLSMNGTNTNNVIVATHDSRYQPNNLKAGEVSLHDYQGQSVELRQNQTINITGQKTIYVNIGENQQIISKRELSPTWR